MKKTVAAVVILLLAALGGLGYVLFGMEEDPFGPEAVAVNQPQLGVKSQPKTDADVLEALDYEISQNRDTIGWLKIPGTKINNSVLQSYDNAYYLRQDERRKYSLYGCYFADYECSFGTRDDLSPNTIIYGHSDLTNNPDGSPVLGAVPVHRGGFCPQYTGDYLYHPGGLDGLGGLCGGRVFHRSPADPAGTRRRHCSTGWRMSGRNRSLIMMWQVGDEDHILTLITCTDDTSVRLVVMARAAGFRCGTSRSRSYRIIR